MHPDHRRPHAGLPLGLSERVQIRKREDDRALELHRGR